MWAADRYRFDLSASPEDLPAVEAEGILAAAWRTDFSAPGFCLLELGAGVDSHALRSLMLGLRDRLGDGAAGRGLPRFAVRSVGRFDQQETTRFHRDGAPDRSLLVLGYEPSKVQSRLSLADHARCAFDLGIKPDRLLDEHNPMYRRGEELLAPYVTELPPAADGHARIVLINNSSLPFAGAGVHPLGVLHKAEILAPDGSERRVVNSMMLVAGGSDEVGEVSLGDFVATEEISRATVPLLLLFKPTACRRSRVQQPSPAWREFRLRHRS